MQRRGLKEITDDVARVVRDSGIQTGICHLFVRHTSASLLLQENADPSARADLERWLDRLAPEDDPAYRHVAEGPDDMPAHLKTAVTSTSESIPIAEAALLLGTWQGIYLFEHRRRPSRREVIVHIIGT
jgi:secondary thiamine-phosphate synthase enzyme